MSRDSESVRSVPSGAAEGFVVGRPHSNSSSGVLGGRVYEDLKGQILSMRIPQGAVLNTAPLAEELGVSRSPVQEALKLLCGDGLLKVKRTVGYEVVRVTVADVEETFQLRVDLEPLAVNLATRRAPRVKIEALVEGLAAPALGDSYLAIHGPIEKPKGQDPFMAKHNWFHVALAQLSGNSSLAQIIEQLILKSHRAISLTAMQHWDNPSRSRPDDHVRIVELMLKGDRGGAVEAMADHIERGFKEVVAALSANPLILQPPDRRVLTAN